MIALEAAGLLLFGAALIFLVWYLSSEPEDLGSVSPAELQRLRDER